MIAKSRQRTRQLLSASLPGLRTGLPADEPPPMSLEGLPGSPPRRPPSFPRGSVTGTGSPEPPKDAPEAPGPWPPAWEPPLSPPPPPGLPPPLSGMPEDGAWAPFPLVIGRLRTALAPRSFKGITKRVRTYNHQPAPRERAFSGNHREVSQRPTHPSLPSHASRAMAPTEWGVSPLVGRGAAAASTWPAGMRVRQPSKRRHSDAVPGVGSARDRGTANIHARGTTPSPSVCGGTVLSQWSRWSRQAAALRPAPYACRGIDLPRSVG